MSVGRPLALSGRTIVCLSTIDWSFLWQGHQEIMSRFAQGGNRVVFVENTGVRSVRWPDAPRIVDRAIRYLAQLGGARRTPMKDVTVIAPILLPFPRSRLARYLNERLLLPRLAAAIKRLSPDDPVVFTYLPTPNAVRLIELLRGPRSVVVYYCVADFRALSDLGADLDDSERRLASQADLVFVQGPEFARRFAPVNSRVHQFRAGVNTDVFDPEAAGSPPPEVVDLPRPVVGYSGGLHRHVDFGLLRRVARSIPSGSVVLVGPIQADPGALREEPNVHFLGGRSLRELARVVQTFDVGLVPYVRTPYTETVYPTKLLEYLAMGRPAVATDLPEVRALGLPELALRIAEDADAFVEAVHAALADGGTAAAAERRRLAKERDWENVVRAMAELIARPR